MTAIVAQRLLFLTQATRVTLRYSGFISWLCLHDDATKRSVGRSVQR
ncbi:MAG TPA: hypothetical protein V6D34_02690 [Candidatus Sericytochromatia bacterium]